MSDFSRMIGSPAFIRAYSSIQSGQTMGNIFVENPTDIPFWQHVVNAVEASRYKVRPIAKEKAAGKRTLQTRYAELNQEFLVAVDSDYDYLCPERHDHAVQLNENPFILHTYCYSRESFQCCHLSVESITDILYYHEALPSEILEALTQYSRCIYPALCAFAYLHNQNWQKYGEDLFKDALTTEAAACLIDDELRINGDLLTRLKTRIDEYCQSLMNDITDRVTFEDFKAELNRKGITEDNAYMFINGHCLQNTVVKPMLEKMVAVTKRAEKASIDDMYPEPERRPTKRQKMNEIDNYYKNERHLSTLLSTGHAFCRHAFFDQIIEKLRALSH